MRRNKNQLKKTENLRCCYLDRVNFLHLLIIFVVFFSAILMIFSTLKCNSYIHTKKIILEKS